MFHAWQQQPSSSVLLWVMHYVAWADACVRIFGSVQLGTTHERSDLDLCVLLPSQTTAHPRDKQGRGRLVPLMRRGWVPKAILIFAGSHRVGLVG